jgi:hypothetical protein
MANSAVHVRRLLVRRCCRQGVSTPASWRRGDAAADRRPVRGEVIRLLADPEVKQKLLIQGLEINAGVAAQSGKLIDA